MTIRHAPGPTRRQRRLLHRYGPYALVTGATSGIGREIAVQLAEAGFHLVLAARREPELRELAAAMAAERPVDVRVLPVDLARPEGADALAAATAGLDVGLYVAAAGFGTSGPFLDNAVEDELDMLRVNCAAVLASTHVLGRRMVARGGGGIVLFSSVVGFQGTPNAAHYAATKAWVQTLAEALYVELRPLGVDVLATAPGPTASGFAARAGMAMGRALAPRDVARATLDTLGRRPTALPGLLSLVLRGSLAPLPRRARVRIMGSVMAGMAGGHVPPGR